MGGMRERSIKFFLIVPLPLSFLVGLRIGFAIAVPWYKCTLHRRRCYCPHIYVTDVAVKRMDHSMYNIYIIRPCRAAAFPWRPDDRQRRRRQRRVQRRLRRRWRRRDHYILLVNMPTGKWPDTHIPAARQTTSSHFNTFARIT